VSFVDYFMKYLPFPATTLHSHVYWYHIWQFDRFSASSLDFDDFRQYPMHMRLNGASKTLIRLIEGVLPISHSYSAKTRCHDSKATATQPPSCPRPPRRHKTSPLSPLSPLMRWIAARRNGRSEWRPFMDK